MMQSSIVSKDPLYYFGGLPARGISSAGGLNFVRNILLSGDLVSELLGPSLHATFQGEHLVHVIAQSGQGIGGMVPAEPSTHSGLSVLWSRGII